MVYNYLYKIRTANVLEKEYIANSIFQDKFNDELDYFPIRDDEEAWALPE